MVALRKKEALMKVKFEAGAVYRVQAIGHFTGAQEIEEGTFA